MNSRIIIHKRDEPFPGVTVTITRRATTATTRGKGKRTSKSLTLHNIEVEEAYQLFVAAVEAANAKLDTLPDAKGGE